MFRAATSISHTAQQSILLVKIGEPAPAVRSPVPAPPEQDQGGEGADYQAKAEKFVGADELAER